MKLFAIVQNNKLFMHYLSILIVIAGVIVIFNMRREARPNVNFYRVTISVAYPGAAPSDIEEFIIDPIEEKIAEVDGIKEYRSVSYVGAGSIAVLIDDSYPNPQEIVDELRRKISEVKNLPLGVEDPAIRELKASNIPVLNLALYGDIEPQLFKLESEKLKDFIQKEKGVQSVSLSGISDLQLKILVNPSKLNQFDITLDEIFNNLTNWSKQKPGGLFENNQVVANLTIGRDLNELNSLENFVLRSNDSGKIIKLSDVAEIKLDLENLQSSSLFEDKEAVLFTIIKRPFFDSIKLVDNLQDSLKKYQKTLPKVLQLKFYKDQSIRIREKLKIVTTNAIFGLILVLIILLIFLDWRSALVTSFGIPIAVLGGLIVLQMLGHTMNSLVVVGIIIVMGMLVDDAIIVCENIYSYLEKGFSPRESAFKGVSEISLPVIASVLTTVFAFLPIVFMKEIIGQFLRVIPITVIALLSISLLEALAILPIHAEELMRPRSVGNISHGTTQLSFFKRLENAYKRYLYWSLEKRGYLIFILSIFLVISGLQGKKIFEKFSLFPAEGLEGCSVRIELPKNTPLEKTKKIVQELSRRLQLVSNDTFDNIISDIGQVVTGGNSGSRQNGSHLASINISFISSPEFITMEKEILKNITQVVENFKIEKNIKASLTIDRPGPPMGKPIQFQITARDYSLGETIVEKIKSELKLISGVHSLETDLDGDSIKYRLNINNELAISEGVDPAKISRTIFSYSTGKVASEILKNNEKVEILLTVQNKLDQSIEKILDLKVRNAHMQAVPLGIFVNIVEEKGPSSIQRLNGLRTITLFGEVDDNVISGKEANVKIMPFIENLNRIYPNVNIDVGGGEKDRMNAVKDTLKLYSIALILIFMIISLTFKSVLYPLLVLTAIPMGLSGVIWSLVVHSKSLSIMGIIGIVGLSGVVVNVSIIFLKFIQDHLKTGKSLRDAIIDAGVSRLRPITMTTLSTLLGLLPTIYGIGGIDTFVQPIALVLGWGLFVATFLTLFFLPAIISYFKILEKN